MRCQGSHLAMLLLVAFVVGCDEVQRSDRGGRETNSQADGQLPCDGVPDAGPAPELTSIWTRQQGVDWPAFLGPTGDSRSPETGILTGWGDAGPPIVWHHRVATSYAAPTISRGRLFLFDRHDPRPGAPGNARLTCMAAETGEKLWQFEYLTDYTDQYGYDNGPRCCPVVDDDRVYIRGVEGMLHCLRVMDGALLWTIDLTQRFGIVQNFFGQGSTPVIEGNLLIVQVGGSPPDANRYDIANARGNGTGVVAFDKHTGAIVYQLSDELCSYTSPTLATIDERRWCFVFARGGLLAFNPADGALDFHFAWRSRLLESVNASNPVVIGNRVLISETYGPGAALLAVRPGDYDIVWADDPDERDKTLQTHWNTPVYHDGYVYGSSGRHANEAELRCVELATGKVMWSEPGLARSSLLFVDGHFICLGEYGELLLLKATPEKFDALAAVVLRADDDDAVLPELRNAPLLRYPAWAAPVLSHGLLYLRGPNMLVCCELIPEETAEQGAK